MRWWFVAMIGCGGGETTPKDTAAPSDTSIPVDTGTAEPPCEAAAANEACVEAGKVIGVAQGQHVRWLGIPFAAPPTGALRFRPPEPPAPLDGPLTADRFGPKCPQWQGDPPAVVGEEDCLTLNVFAPPDAEDAPVLVFVHGGGHQQGSSSQELAGTDEVLYDGASIVEHTGAVVVTTNYRIGPLGFLAHPALRAEGEGSGNFGMLDQIAALSWVRDNVAAFGGDPDRVVVFGESAGAVSVCRLLASPRASGLFAGAIMQSGACVAKPRDAAEQYGIDIVSEPVGCEAADDVAACLRAKTVDELMATVDPLEDLFSAAERDWDGVIDGTLLPDAPRTLLEGGGGNDVPVIMGSNAEEMGNSVPPVPSAKVYEEQVRAMALAAGIGPVGQDAILAQYPVDDYDSPRAALVALSSDATFTCPNRRDARVLRDAFDAPVYRYHFSQIPENGGLAARYLGAFHGLELVFLFDRIDVLYEVGSTDAATTTAMQSAWSGLAAAGVPGAGWTPFAVDESVTLLTDGATVGADPRAEHCDFWETLGR